MQNERVGEMGIIDQTSWQRKCSEHIAALLSIEDSLCCFNWLTMTTEWGRQLLFDDIYQCINLGSADYGSITQFTLLSCNKNFIDITHGQTCITQCTTQSQAYYILQNILVCDMDDTFLLVMQYFGELLRWAKVETMGNNKCQNIC